MACNPSSIIPFTFESSQVRVIVDEHGAPWFVAADVLATLGVDRTSLERLEEDEKGVDTVHTPGGPQAMTTISEPGLYALVLTSRKAEAKRFKRWVTHDVLPAIRKTGAYSVQGFSIPQTKAEALRLAADLAEQVEQQQRELEAQQRQLAAQAPDVAFVERYVEAKATKSIREVAKVLGLKERAFIAALERDGVLFRQSGRPLPAAEYQHRGYFEVKTGEANGHPFVQPRFTPAGIAWAAKRYAMPEAQQAELAPPSL